MGLDMDINKFKEQVNRLKKAFGENFYNDARVDMMWDLMKKSSPIVLREAVDYLIGSEKTSPTPHKLRDVVKEKEKFEERRYESPIGQPCDTCNGSGSVTRVLKREGQDYDYTFRCSCPNNTKWSNSIPVWDEWKANHPHML